MIELLKMNRETTKKGEWKTYRLPLSSGSWPSMSAASPTTPLPSTTFFSISTRRRIDRAMAFSLHREIDLIEKCVSYSMLWFWPTNYALLPLSVDMNFILVRSKRRYCEAQRCKLLITLVLQIRCSFMLFNIHLRSLESRFVQFFAVQIARQSWILAHLKTDIMDSSYRTLRILSNNRFVTLTRNLTNILSLATSMINGFYHREARRWEIEGSNRVRSYLVRYMVLDEINKTSAK